MKKLIIILAIIIIAGIGVGVFFGVKSCNQKKELFEADMSILQEEYKVGEKIYFDYRIYSDSKLKSLTYTINNGDEKTISNAKFGETGELKENKSKRKYYADTRIVEIETGELKAGWYTISFFGYEETTNKRLELTKEPYIFKLSVKE